MGYLHIPNLYKDQTILLFKECYALEKVHGTSTNIQWNPREEVRLKFFSGGIKQKTFEDLFDHTALDVALTRISPGKSVTIYGEAYGGSIMKMRDTYGPDIRFVAFDVQVGETWLNVVNADYLVGGLDLDFVCYHKTSTFMDSLDYERDLPSSQAAKFNPTANSPHREGVVLRPLEEFTRSNGQRVIAKHKREEFRETATPRNLSPEALAATMSARDVAAEWVTTMRLAHVLDKTPGAGIENMKVIIDAMVEDVLREGAGEVEDTLPNRKAIGAATAVLFKSQLKEALNHAC
jgi:hypothetical protein